MKFGTALLLFLLVVSQSVDAESALEVESRCRAFATIEIGVGGQIKYPQSADFCWGAFMALQQLQQIVDDADTPVLGACPPPSGTRVQLIKVFLTYSQQHPELAHMDFAVVALRALQAAFPCGPK